LTFILQRQQLSLNPTATMASLNMGTITKIITGMGGMFDLGALIKIWQSLSEKIELEEAIANFRQAIGENAGAETVALMLFQKQVLMFVAKVTNEELSLMNIDNGKQKAIIPYLAKNE